mmetsp:Transcript_115464/g.321031  ORF Transcript_115464/g.321031 Transcript_115464/m.321031 type:complete len:256 (-) Transcript_115464:1062-1829(-)
MPQAFFECTAAKSSVASPPTAKRMLEAPPGWSFKYGVQSYTRPSTAIQADLASACLSNSSMGMPSLSHSGREVTSFPACSPPAAGAGAGGGAGAASREPGRQTAAVGRFGATPLAPGDASVAFAGSNFPASSVIQPPVSVPGCVGCSNHTAGPSSVVMGWTFMRKRQLFIIPMTFQVRCIGCMFWFESTARQMISLHCSSRTASTSVSHHAQHQCLSVPRAAAISSSGRVRLAISQDKPPSNEISARMIRKPPPT